MTDSAPSDDRVFRHLEAAARHEEAALRHEEAARYWRGNGDEDIAELERRCVDLNREGAQIERDRAALLERRDQAAA